MMHSLAILAAYLAAHASAQTNTNLQTTFPKASGTTNLAAVRTIAAGQTFDGGLKQWDRSRKSIYVLLPSFFPPSLASPPPAQKVPSPPFLYKFPKPFILSIHLQRTSRRRRCRRRLLVTRRRHPLQRDHRPQ